MPTNKRLEELLEAYDQSIIFRFFDEEARYVIIGWPKLRAFICSLESEIWVELKSITIDLLAKRILFAQRDNQINTNKTQEPISMDFYSKRILLPFKRNLGNKKIISEPTFFEHLINDDTFLKKEIKFFSLFPEQFIAIVKRFSGENHWPLIKAISEDVRVVDLLISNPALGFMVCNSDEFNPHLQYGVKELVVEKRKKIAMYFNLPNTQECVNILSKICIGAINLSSLKSFVKIVAQNKNNDSFVKYLSHIKEIDANTLQLIISEPMAHMILSVKLFEEISKSANYKYYLTRISLIVKLAKKLHLIQNTKITCLQSIDVCYDKLKSVYDLYVKAKKIKVSFPVSGNEFITPLDNLQDFKHLSRILQNCLMRKYKASFLSGKLLFYKIEVGNEIACLSIIPFGEKSFTIDQLKGFRNQNVSEGMIKIVAEKFNIPLNEIREREFPI